jgi:small GTP-binding protein
MKFTVIGDEGVGKSSLISTFISKHFPLAIPNVLETCILPAEVTEYNVAITIIDTSASHDDEEVLKLKLRESDTILVLYDLSRKATFESLSTKWLPLLSIDNSTKNVIVVGTKSDLVEEEENEEVEVEIVNDLLSKFQFVLLSLKCSALNDEGIIDLFQLCELFTKYPVQTLYDLYHREFKQNCRLALLRIFRILDQNHDNLLSDDELSILHTCFSDIREAEEIDFVLYKNELVDAEYIIDNKLTFEGFFYDYYYYYFLILFLYFY